MAINNTKIWENVTANLDSGVIYNQGGLHSAPDQTLVTVDSAVEMCQQYMNYVDRLETYLGIMVIAFMLLLIYILYKRGRFTKGDE